MFPARAGMSRRAGTSTVYTLHVPRASGDEPERGACETVIKKCSPRERG